MAFRRVCDRDWKDPLWGPVSSQVSSVAFCFDLSEICCYEYHSLFLLKLCCLWWYLCHWKAFFPERSGRDFFTLPSFLELFSIKYYRSWVIIYWLNKCPEYLPGTVLVGCGLEQYWWKFCPRKAYGFEGCHGAVIGCTKLFFLDLFCHRVDSIPSDSFI